MMGFLVIESLLIRDYLSLDFERLFYRSCLICSSLSLMGFTALASILGYSLYPLPRNPLEDLSDLFEAERWLPSNIFLLTVLRIRILYVSSEIF